MASARLQAVNCRLRLPKLVVFAVAKSKQGRCERLILLAVLCCLWELERSPCVASKLGCSWVRPCSQLFNGALL
eukprot:5014592-Amphidinium_carterae.1